MEYHPLIPVCLQVIHKKGKGQCLVCPLWATVETELCNMVDSMEEELIIGFTVSGSYNRDHPKSCTLDTPTLWRECFMCLCVCVLSYKSVAKRILASLYRKYCPPVWSAFRAFFRHTKQNVACLPASLAFIGMSQLTLTGPRAVMTADQPLYMGLDISITPTKRWTNCKGVG